MKNKAHDKELDIAAERREQVACDVSFGQRTDQDDDDGMRIDPPIV